MYLIRYELYLGDTEACAPSAAGALELIARIRADGGSLRSIEDRNNDPLALMDIEQHALAERDAAATRASSDAVTTH